MSSVTEAITPEIVAPARDGSDDRLLEVWLHGRSPLAGGSRPRGRAHFARGRPAPPPESRTGAPEPGHPHPPLRLGNAGKRAVRSLLAGFSTELGWTTGDGPATRLPLVQERQRRSSAAAHCTTHRGALIRLVQATLGHASITTTGRYLHVRPNDSSSRFLPL
jgi:hypothetical protein